MRLLVAAFLAPALAAAELPALRIATGHGDQAVVVRLDDGRRLLSSGGDGTTRLWDALRRREVRRWEGLRGQPIVAPDGRRALIRGATAAVIGLDDGARGPDLVLGWGRGTVNAIERPWREPADAAMWLPDASAFVASGPAGMAGEQEPVTACWTGSETPPADDAGWRRFAAVLEEAAASGGRITGAVHAAAARRLAAGAIDAGDGADPMRFADLDEPLLNAVPRWNAPGRLVGLSPDGAVAVVAAAGGAGLRAYRTADGAEAALPAEVVTPAGVRLPAADPGLLAEPEAASAAAVPVELPAPAPFLVPDRVEVSPDGRRCLVVQAQVGWAVFELASGRWLAGGADGAAAPRRFLPDGSLAALPARDEAQPAQVIGRDGSFALDCAWGESDGSALHVGLRQPGVAAVELAVTNVLAQELSPHLRGFEPVFADRAAGILALVVRVQGALDAFQHLALLPAAPAQDGEAVWSGQWGQQGDTARCTGWARLAPDGRRILYADEAAPALLVERPVGPVELARWTGPSHDGDTGSSVQLRRPGLDGLPPPPPEARRFSVPALVGEARRLPGHDRAIRDAAWSADGAIAVTAAADATVGVWVSEGGVLRAAYRWAGDARGAWVALLPDGGYAGAREAVPWVYRLDGTAVVPFTQFDLIANRPDRVLAAMPGADARLIAACRAAWSKRVRAMGLSPAALEQGGDPAALPTATVDLAAVPTRSAQRSLAVRVRAAAAAGLAAVEGRIDEVPVAAVPLAGAAAEVELALPLAAGDNHIEIVVRDARGRLSRPEAFTVACTAAPGPRRLYLACLGVSAYAGPLEALAFAAKDAHDLAAALGAGNAAFAAVEPLVLTDAAVSRGALERVRAHLAQAGVDDAAVLFIAGHGLLDRDLSYWFATAATDPADPAAAGIAFAELEAALAATPARDRVLLMDTCHAGEVDRGAAGPALPPQVRVATRGLRAGAVGEDEAFRLMRELFVDLRRGSGAVAITASAGAEYAEESGDLRNGVFTASVIRSLREAPRDGLRAGALQAQVARRVAELTAGRQTPTARLGNLVRDPLLFRPR